MIHTNLNHDKRAVLTLTLTKAHELIEALSNPTGVVERHFPHLHQAFLTGTAWDPQFIFRGVGCSEQHRLVPTALRPESNKLICVYDDPSATLNGPRCAVNQKWAELRLVCAFYRHAHRAGLPLPQLCYRLHKALLDGDQSQLTVDTSEEQTFPIPELFPIFGIAQHYGLPTRLLDWSHSPFVAAFFAAQSAMAMEDKVSAASYLAVWLLSADYLKRTSKSEVHLIEPPTTGNPNLRLQQGVFTLQRYTNVPYEALDDALRAQWRGEKIKEGFPLLLKMELPRTEARALMHQLGILGFSANRIYDGYQGAAESVRLGNFRC